jgi:3'(2'), 5'-bisphosphate nucleotidase
MFESFSTKDAVVWIDPLDGTTDFVNGNLPAVTVLIGLSIREKSRLGVVHKPFTDEDQAVSMTVFGSAEHGVFVLPCDKTMSVEKSVLREPKYLEPFDHEEVPSEDHNVKVGASLTHFSGTLKEIIEKASPVDIIRLGGAGNKCLALAVARTEAYMHPNPGLKYWDLCSNESLIKAMGGYSTNLFGERLTYPLEGNHSIRGLILAKNPPMYNLIMKRLGDSWVQILKNVKL